MLLKAALPEHRLCLVPNATGLITLFEHTESKLWLCRGWQAAQCQVNSEQEAFTPLFNTQQAIRQSLLQLTTHGWISYSSFSTTQYATLSCEGAATAVVIEVAMCSQYSMEHKLGTIKTVLSWDSLT